MRRYSRRMQSSGVVKRMRGLRYFKRNTSAASAKKDALTRIKRTEKYIQMYKDGREMPNKRRR